MTTPRLNPNLPKILPLGPAIPLKATPIAPLLDSSMRAAGPSPFAGLLKPLLSGGSAPGGGALPKDLAALIKGLGPLGSTPVGPQQDLVDGLVDALVGRLVDSAQGSLEFQQSIREDVSVRSQGPGHDAELAGRLRGGVEGKVDGGLIYDGESVGVRGHAEAFAGVEGELEAHLQTDALEAHGRARVAAEAYAEVDGQATFDGKSVRIDATAEAGARVSAEAEGAFRTAGFDVGGQRVDINGHGTASVEAGAFAEGEANVDIGLDGIEGELGGTAFAGARAEARGEVGIGEFVKVSGEAGAWAGIGAEGKAIFAFKDGKLAIGLGGGIAKGVGAGAEGQVEVDVKKIGLAALGAGFDVATAPLRYSMDPSAIGRDVEKLADGVTTLASLPGDVNEAVQGIATGIVEQITSGALKGGKDEAETPPLPVQMPTASVDPRADEAANQIAESLLPLIQLALQLERAQAE